MHVDLVKNISQRVGDVFKFFIVDQAGDDQCSNHINGRTDQQGIDHSLREIFLWIAAFFSRRGNGIKADIGKENRGDALQNAIHSFRKKG